MISIKDLPELRVKNIRRRVYPNNRILYSVRVQRKTKDKSKALLIKSYLLQVVGMGNSVGIYEKDGFYSVQCFKEYDNLEIAIRVRDYIESKLKEVEL